MADQLVFWKPSMSTTIHHVAGRPKRPADRTYIQDGRGCLVLVATVALAVNAWALFPSLDESGHNPPPLTVSPPSSAGVDSAGVAGGPLDQSGVDAVRFTRAEMIVSESTWKGPWRYSSPTVDITIVPLRSKLETLLNLLHLQPFDVGLAALEAKIQTLLELPDSMLAQLMSHPDLVNLDEMLDAVFLGTSDVAGVKTELDKIDVAYVPGTSEQIKVIRVGSDLAYAVRSPAGGTGMQSSAVSLVSAPAPAEQRAFASPFDALASMALSAFGMAPNSAPPPPPPPPQQPAPPPVPEPLYSAARMVAPISEEPAPPAPPPAPEPEAPKPLAGPTDTVRTSLDVINSGNMFEVGETAAEQNAQNPPETSSPAVESASPSPPATGAESPPEPGGGGEPPSSGNEGGGTPEGEPGP